MSTRQTMEAYFAALAAGGDWTHYIANDVTFTNLASPPRVVKSKDAFLEATSRFSKSIESVQVRDLLVEGDKACAFTAYLIHAPNGTDTFESNVAELFEVRDGRIVSLSICFDTAPYRQ